MCFCLNARLTALNWCLNGRVLNLYFISWAKVEPRAHPKDPVQLTPSALALLLLGLQGGELAKRFAQFPYSGVALDSGEFLGLVQIHRDLDPDDVLAIRVGSCTNRHG